MSKILHIQNLSITPNNKKLPVLSDINISLSGNDAHAIITQNQQGQHLLKDYLLGKAMDKNYQIQGDILLGDAAIALRQASPEHDEAQTPIAYIPSYSASLFNPQQKIGKQLTLMLRDVGIKSEQVAENITAIFNKLKFAEQDKILASLPNNLAILAQYKIFIATTLINKPHLVIMDKMLYGLTAYEQKEIIACFKLFRHKDMALLLFDHRFELAGELCQHISHLYQGKIIETGKVEKILNAPDHAYSHAILATSSYAKKSTQYFQPLIFNN